jgi:hypothetical protein
MPDFETMLARLNARFANIDDPELSPDLFDGSQPLSQVALALEIAQGDDVNIIDDIPNGMRQAIRAFIQADLTAELEPRRPITFVVVPGYDYELKISYGWPGPKGHVVQLQAPYPRDGIARGRV